MKHRLIACVLCCLMLAACASSSDIRTNACPANYKWDSVQRFCAPA